MKRLLTTTAIVAGALYFGALMPADAALVTCPEPGFTTEPNAKVENSLGSLTATIACQYIVPPDQSNTNKIANINAAGFFGDSKWQDNGQTQTAGGAAGTWSINNPDFATYDYAIFFKDGNETNLIGFVFNEQFTSGSWVTPFTKPPFDLSGGSTSHDVSDVTIARTLIKDCPDCGINPVITPAPEPASLALLGVGILGIAALRRRTTD